MSPMEGPRLQRAAVYLQAGWLNPGVVMAEKASFLFFLAFVKTLMVSLNVKM